MKTKTKQSHEAKIKAHLKSGKSISGLQALRLYGCYRLSAVIFRLRDEGLKISTTIKNKEHFATYKLNNK